MPKDKPDLAIVIADKARKDRDGKGGEDEEGGRYDAMAADMIEAIEGGDKELLASILRALAG